MDAMSWALTVALCWFPVHAKLTQADWSELGRWLLSLRESKPVDSQKEARVEEEMLKLRQRNYKLFCRCLSHLDLLIGLFLLPGALGTQTLTSWISVSLAAMSYATHLTVVQDMVDLTPRWMKSLTTAMHILTLFFILTTGWSANALECALFHGFQTAVRFCLVLAFLDPLVSIPFQVLYTIAESLVHCFVFEASTVRFLCWSQGFVFVVSIASLIFLDLALRGRIEAQLDTADAESLLGSFRRLLRGVCDGELLLDGQMKVAEDSECLKHLIFTDISLRGRDFCQLMVDDSRRRFADFVATQLTVATVADGAPAGLPQGLRVSFRDVAGGFGVAADLYHVPVPKLFGSDEPYHLIAFKEDPEARTQPDAKEDSVPAELQTWHAAIHRQARRVSLSAASTGSCEFVPELDEVTLLLDLDTELHEVQQAHWNFARCLVEGDPQAAPSESMPSLKSMVKPFAWEKLKATVQRFHQRSLEDPEIPPKVIQQIPVKLPGQSAWVVTSNVSIHRIRGANKVWLHLKGFHPERSRTAPLEGIQER